MDSTKNHFEQRQPTTSGAAAKAQQLRGHSSATAAELREFLGQLKGRSPQEVMGIVAQSSLVRGISTATIACGVVLLVFTIGPYLIYGGPGARAQQNTVAVTVQPDTSEPDAPAQPSPDTAATEPTKPDLAKAAQAMGIGETVEAAPDKNPLDSKLDDLLDGIE